MYIEEQEIHPQRKEPGKVAINSGNLEMIVYDMLTRKFRLVGLSTGNIYLSEYDSIDELWKDNGDMVLAESAHIVIQY
jgi:hypothetical protein